MLLQGIQKWESIMSDALIKLRDYSEKRLVPACQRLHIVLEELQGWQKMCVLRGAQAFLGLSDTDNRACALGGNAQYSSSTVNRLGKLSTTRPEQSCLEAFWLLWCAESISDSRSLSHGCGSVRLVYLGWSTAFNVAYLEIANTPGPSDSNLPRHDILEVNNYLESGLESSQVDAWFDGDLAPFEPQHLGVPNPSGHSLASVIKQAKTAACTPADLAWQEVCDLRISIPQTWP